MKGVLWVVAGLAMFAAPQTSLAMKDDETALHELAAFMLNDYATSPENLKETIIDRRIPLHVEGEEGVWFYSQLNTGDDQKLYRQRFNQLILADDGKTIVHRSYAAKAPERFADAWGKPDVLENLASADLEVALNEGCAQRWVKDGIGVWRGTVDPQTCMIFSQRRQANIRIGADGYYRGNILGVTERGFDDAMNFLWGSQSGEFIELTRCRSHLCARESTILSAREE